MRTVLVLVALLLGTWTVLVSLGGCTSGGRQSDGTAVPCETVVILASPGGYVACPGAPPLPLHGVP